MTSAATATKIHALLLLLALTACTSHDADQSHYLAIGRNFDYITIGYIPVGQERGQAQERGTSLTMNSGKLATQTGVGHGSQLSRIL